MPQASDQSARTSRDRLHDGGRVWTETNCYVDLWIELLAHLGYDPVPALGCTLSAGFEGDQWTFLKFDLGDLRRLYGIEVAEMNVWRSVLEHVLEQRALGNLVTVEADSHWLPDTAGVSYRLTHAKTTIAPLEVDADRRWMRYTHNAGIHVLEGDDFDHVFDMRGSDGLLLPPYMESVRIDRRLVGVGLAERAVPIVRDHVARRAAGNPVELMAQRVADDLPWLREAGLDTFHLYAFAFIRQCGFTAELAGDLCDWLTAECGAPLGGAAEQFRLCSHAMKTLQFRLARAVSGRDADVLALAAPATLAWEQAMSDVVRWSEGLPTP